MFNFISMRSKASDMVDILDISGSLISRLRSNCVNKNINIKIYRHKHAYRHTNTHLYVIFHNLTLLEVCLCLIRCAIQWFFYMLAYIYAWTHVQWIFFAHFWFLFFSFPFLFFIQTHNSQMEIFFCESMTTMFGVCHRAEMRVFTTQ